MTTIRAAVVQAAPVSFDRDRSIDRVRTLAVEAAASGASLIVFPEAFVPGYPRGLDFGARVGWRTPEGREWFRRYWESAVEVPSPEASAIGEAARSASAHLAVGVVERDGGDALLLGFDLRPGRAPAGQAPQAHAHRLRAARLGIWRRLDPLGD